MKIILWSILILFLAGDAFFVLPYHFSEDKISTNYSIKYKKDSLLLKNVFPDSAIQLKLNIPQPYETIYKSMAKTEKTDRPSHLFVNISISHNLDFTALAFPFYKVTTFNGVIPFYSIIKASNAPDMDSTALIGNIVINGKLDIKGICTPLYARNLVEKELAAILNKEMNKIELDINRPPDTGNVILPLAPPRPVKREKSKRK